MTPVSNFLVRSRTNLDSFNQLSDRCTFDLRCEVHRAVYYKASFLSKKFLYNLAKEVIRLE